MSGLLSLLTDREQPKVMGMALSDYVTGLSAAYGILGGLLAREQSGAGCRVETSLLQATFSFIGETAAGTMRTGSVPSRMARVKNAHAFAFLCKDGLPLAIHCSVPKKFWLALLNALDKADLAKDERFATRDARRENYEALETELAPVFATRTRAQWLARLEGFDVPVAPIYNMGEVLSDPQVRHLGLIEELNDVKAGRMGFAGPPVTYAGLSSTPSLPPPMLGAQTRPILSELGYSETAAEELIGLLVARTHDET
jgi:formyl-CoA transferase